MENTELENVRPEKVTLLLHGKEREIKFGFSAWAVIEKEYNGLKNIDKLQEELENKPFEVIPHLLFIGVKDKEGLTEENILDDYGLNDVQMITDVFTKALYGSLPQNSSNEKKAEREA